jgi:hypothetical protein
MSLLVVVLQISFRNLIAMSHYEVFSELDEMSVLVVALQISFRNLIAMSYYEVFLVTQHHVNGSVSQVQHPKLVVFP